VHDPKERVNEDLLFSAIETGKPQFRVYEPQTTEIVLGAAGKQEKELYLEEVEKDGVPVHRRSGGGGTVVLSRGQVVVALVKEVNEQFRNVDFMRRINQWIADVLSLLGVTGIENAGISDLALNGKKIMGSSMHRKKYFLFYQSSLLVDNDIKLFNRYLKYPARVPDYRKGRGHSEFCTSLNLEGYSLPVKLIADKIRVKVREKIEEL